MKVVKKMSFIIILFHILINSSIAKEIIKPNKLKIGAKVALITPSHKALADRTCSICDRTY